MKSKNGKEKRIAIQENKISRFNKKSMMVAKKPS